MSESGSADNHNRPSSPTVYIAYGQGQGWLAYWKLHSQVGIRQQQRGKNCELHSTDDPCCSDQQRRASISQWDGELLRATQFFCARLPRRAAECWLMRTTTFCCLRDRSTLDWCKLRFAALHCFARWRRRSSGLRMDGWRENKIYDSRVRDWEQRFTLVCMPFLSEFA